jgi:hypothetical protein
MTNKILHSHISDYLESQKRDIITDEFAYSTYAPPNTMFSISNDMPMMMLAMPPGRLKVWLVCLSLMKRNHDPTIACSIVIKHEYFKDYISKSRYHICIKELIKDGLLVATPKKSVVIIHIAKASKLFKPKLEI